MKSTASALEFVSGSIEIWINKLIDSFIENEDPPSDEYNSALWCLGRSIEFLVKADVVVFVDGWHHARGCKIEFECCVEYGIPMMFDHGAKYE